MIRLISSDLHKNREKIRIAITDQCSCLIHTIRLNHKAIMDELLKYESFEAAKDEIWHSLDCLNNISQELKWLSYGKVNLLCSIIPINLPLYSLVLFGIIPGFMSNEVIVRPPILMIDILKKIIELLNLKKLMPHIKFIYLERSLFGEAYISVADVVIFTGRYENAKLVQKICPKALFIYDGTGVNPIIIADSAQIELAVKKTIKTRIFNSGQDCAGPDVIFIHEKILYTLKDALLSELTKLKIGDYQNRDVRIGPLIKKDILPEVNDFFHKHAKSLIYGGRIDMDKGIIYPTVFIEDIDEIEKFTLTEFFSPVFYLCVYHHNSDIQRIFSQKSYSDFAMYVSFFVESQPDIEIPNSVILHNQIPNDIERGNNPYGGYGPKANFISYEGVNYHRPLLISREICMHLERQSLKSKQS